MGDAAGAARACARFLTPKSQSFFPLASVVSSAIFFVTFSVIVIWATLNTPTERHKSFPAPARVGERAPDFALVDYKLLPQWRACVAAMLVYRPNGKKMP